MNKNCAFTIVAKNYIGLATVLGQSIARYNTTTDFYIIVADEIDSQDIVIPNNVLIAKQILNFTEDEWRDMAFKFNLTEFCTTLKPFSLTYFISKGYERVIYLDPDTYFFSDIDQIFSLLDNRLVVLSPHLINIPKEESTDISETTFLNCGIYNLGFVAVKASGKIKRMLDWWGDRLMKYGYVDYEGGMFTDQLWMNFIPGFFSAHECEISRNLGLDVAPWNYSERFIENVDDEYYVSCRFEKTRLDKLVFAHFSGYDYSELLKRTVIQKSQPRLKNYPDVDIILKKYIDNLIDNKDLYRKYLALPYTYNFFSNGVKIPNFARRLYRGLNESPNLGDPFSSENRLYNILTKKRFIRPQGKQDLDKLNKITMSNVPVYEKIINMGAKLFVTLFGGARYSLLLRYLRRFSNPESQTFLVQNDNNSIK